MDYPQNSYLFRSTEETAMSSRLSPDSQSCSSTQILLSTEQVSAPTLAALSEGKLFFVGPDGAPKRHESDFGQEILERHQRMAQKDSWKGAGGNAGEKIRKDGTGSTCPRRWLAGSPGIGCC